eukprot:GHUV01002144.1.p1 GENE.GHUV01002144.1~~GHUV01002144.1.p1  ORF type:complete len:178 (+),score=27.67 GHUV01002144.1:222-755(+)
MAHSAAVRQGGRIGQFRGDGEGLVDCLIQACEQKPVSSTLSASFGRDLVPWTDESVFCVTFEALEGRGRQTGPVPRASKGGARATSARKSVKSGKDQSKAADSPRTGTGQHAGVKRASSNGFACPALASAPKPCDLPMPTSALMNRAGVRSRSPSPPGKDGNFPVFGQVQQLVRVAA